MHAHFGACPLALALAPPHALLLCQLCPMLCLLWVVAEGEGVWLIQLLLLHAILHGGMGGAHAMEA